LASSKLHRHEASLLDRVGATKCTPILFVRRSPSQDEKRPTVASKYLGIDRKPSIRKLTFSMVAPASFSRAIAMALKSAPERGARDWKFARPRRPRSSNGSRPAPMGTSNSPSNPKFFIGITREWGQTEQIATFGELVDHEVTTGCFEEPVEMRPSRHRRDVLCIGDHEVPSR
jgi:hypothetical protein